MYLRGLIFEYDGLNNKIPVLQRWSSDKKQINEFTDTREELKVKIYNISDKMKEIRKFSENIINEKWVQILKIREKISKDKGSSI